MLEGRLRLIASGREAGLLAVRDTGKLHLISPASCTVDEFGLYAEVPSEPVAAAVTLSTVALVYAAEPGLSDWTLMVRPALYGMSSSPRGELVLPGNAQPTAVDVLPTATDTMVAVASGFHVLLYGVSTGFAITVSRRLSVGTVDPSTSISAACLLDSSSSVAVVVGDELRVSVGGVLARLKLPAAIGRPVRTVVPVPGGLAIVGPAGVWGIALVPHPEKQMWGRRFFRFCDGQHGALIEQDGLRFCVWGGRGRAPDEAVHLKIGPEGFA